MIQPGKILIFGKKPEISLKVRLFGVGKKNLFYWYRVPNSGKRWREGEHDWLWRFEPFSKLETAFCEYQISIKIKINMTCMFREYEIKTMEQEQCLHLKILLVLKIYLVLTWKLFFSGRVGGNKNPVGNCLSWRGEGGGMSKFSAGYPNSDVLFLGLHDPPFLCVY